MSKLVGVMFVAMVGGAGALAAWNVSLQSDLDAMGAKLDSSSAVQASADAEPARRVVRETNRPTARDRELLTRIDELEARLANLPKPTASVASAAVVAADSDEVGAAALGDADPLPTAYKSTEFQRAVESVLDAREETRRRERMERQAEAVARGLTRGLEVSDQLQAELSAATLDYLARRDTLRQDESLTPEEKKARVETLDTERDSTIAAMFDGDALVQVQRRLERGTQLNGRRRQARAMAPQGGRRGDKAKRAKANREGGIE